MEDCPIKAPEPRAGDYVVDIDESSFAYIEVDGEGADIRLSGQVIFRPEDSDCTATQDSPCTVSLKYLELNVADFELPTTEGTALIENVRIATAEEHEIQGIPCTDPVLPRVIGVA